MRRKHLYLIDYISPASCYGIGSYLQQIIDLWNNRAMGQLTIVKLNATDENIEETWTDNVRYLWFPQCEENDYPLLAEGILQCIDPTEDNIFHFNHFHILSFAEAIKRLIPDCKIILTIHYFNWCMMANGRLSILISALKKKESERNKVECLLYKDTLFTKRFFTLSNIVICSSDFARKILIDIYKVEQEKIRLIYNAIPNSVCSVPSVSDDKKERILLFVGRLVEQKGVFCLIKAFRILLEKHKNLRLILVGSGDHERVLRESKGMEEYVILTGNIEKEKVYQIYRQAEIGILPSWNEQCSYVMIEMMMHGLPIVATDSTGLAEMIKEGYNGYKVHVEEDIGQNQVFFIQKLALSLNKILTLSAEELECMRRNSRERYLSRYTIKEMDEKMYKIWTF